MVGGAIRAVAVFVLPPVVTLQPPTSTGREARHRKRSPTAAGAQQFSTSRHHDLLAHRTTPPISRAHRQAVTSSVHSVSWREPSHTDHTRPFAGSEWRLTRIRHSIRFQCGSMHHILAHDEVVPPPLELLLMPVPEDPVPAAVPPRRRVVRIPRPHLISDRRERVAGPHVPIHEAAAATPQLGAPPGPHVSPAGAPVRAAGHPVAHRQPLAAAAPPPPTPPTPRRRC